MNSNRYRLFLLGVSLLILAGLAGPAAAIIVTPKVDVDRPMIPADEPTTVYIVVEFDIPRIEIDRDESRPDLNLGLVIDRSGSMEQRGKMEYAKASAMTVVDKLTPADHLAVVEYDDEITVLWPSSPVVAPEKIKNRISSLRPRNSTNLTGGMMEGVDQVLKSMVAGGINRVILLSDGLANTGVTDPARIKSLVREARRKGVSISTMGLGLDYNEDLMQMIAEHAGGNYYFIENPKQMHSIYEREMGVMFATVAKNVSATMRIPRTVKDIRVYGYPFERTGSDIKVDLGDIYSGEKLSLVIGVELGPESAGRVALGDLELNYIDVADNSPQNFSQALAVEATRDKASVASNENREIAVEAALVVADDFHEQQIRLYEQGNMDEALANLSQLAEDLTKRNAVLGDVQLEKKLEAIRMESELMQTAEQDADQKSAYVKGNKARFYNSMQGKRGSYLLQKGDRGYEVEQLQNALKDKGFYTGPVDGNYSEALNEAVLNYQKSVNLKADGVAGPKTLRELGLY